MSRPTRSLALVLVLLVTAFAAPSASVSSASAAATSHHALGIRLVNQFFRKLQRHDVPALRNFLSPAFQIQRADGSRQTKSQYLRNLPTVLSYKVRDFVVTGGGNELVATYQAKTTEMVNGQQVASAYAPRISVFARGAKGWQIVSQGNFNRPS